MSRLVVDSQVHIWEEESVDAGNWPAEVDVKDWTSRPLTAEGLIAQMDSAGVERAFVIPPAFDGVGNNTYCLAAASRYPKRLAVMGRIALDAPGAVEQVEAWADEPRGLGLRFSIFMPRQRQWLSDGSLDWFWPLAERLNIPVMIYPGPDRDLIEAVGRVAFHHESLRLSIDHMAVGPYDIYDEAAFSHLEWLLDLARLPNVAMKASALPEYSTEGYPYRNLHQYLKRTVDAFGPERVFWGTDLPRLQSPYRDAVTMFTEELDFLSEAELDQVMGVAVCNWHSWDLPEQV